LALPTLPSIIISLAFLFVGVPIAYLTSRALKLHPKPIVIADPKKEATMTYIVIVVVYVATTLLAVFDYVILTPSLHLDHSSFGPINILFQVPYYIGWLLPVVIVMRRTKQNRGSIGISRENTGRMLMVGFTLSAVLFVAAGFLASSLGGGFAGFSASLVYGFIVFVFAGFREELVWRGYIQTRFVAYGGTLKGLVVTAILFSLLHFPVRYYQFSGVPLDALASSLLLLPLSLLFGYVMLRTQNVIPSSVFHIIYNWSLVSVWLIPTY
jgi:membrane protease YdiL (CAAX protease family)